MTLGDP